MQFNSPVYALFLILVFFIFWFLLNKRLRLQNFFLLAVSYIFYGWWDWRFLSLIIFSSLVDYFAGIQLGKTEALKKRRLFLSFSLLTNLGLLGVFKYFNFFSGSLAELFNNFGYKLDALTLNVVLPVGISFYTFQTLSYTIDVYRKKLEPTKDFISFFAYVSFFPQLVAGPIERAVNLLPQFQRKKEFDYDKASDGMRQILWGLFKKVVIADNCAIFVNEIFKNYESQPASVLIMGTIYFAFQIYCDFSGYSDIAIGSAKLLGFDLMTNFKTPYFARDIAEFWRRWHISLSTWFRDYVYIPLGGSRSGKNRALINTMVVFIVSGFWHGANWTFLAWGALNGAYYIPLFLAKQNRKNLDTVAEGRLFPDIKEILQMGITFTLTCIAWIFFRAESISKAFNYLGGIFTHRFLPDNAYYFPKFMMFLLSFFLLCEWFLFRHENFLERFDNLNPFYRRSAYALTLVLIFLFIQNEASTFIYFQF
jgi:alginate O-acetyltransferase complex protein AlgI